MNATFQGDSGSEMTVLGRREMRAACANNYVFGCLFRRNERLNKTVWFNSGYLHTMLTIIETRKS